MVWQHDNLDKEFLQRVTENTKRYVSIFGEAIDMLMPDSTEAFQVDDDHDLLMTQRADGTNDSADNSDPMQKMPREIKRF